jgi:hypothetical protein
VDAFKYIAFDRSFKGIIKLNRCELDSGKHLALEAGDQVELFFDAEKMEARVVTTRL